MRITHIGGPTTLIEVGGWRLLTDPTFDPPGRRYSFGWGTSSRKLTGPAVRPADLGAVDAVLLTHDHHADNLDTAGRALLPVAGHGGHHRGRARGGSAGGARGLRAVGKHHAGGARPARRSRSPPRPCRHGPPLSGPITGEVAGFALRWDGQQHGVLWISGDTVLYDGVRQVAARLDVDVALLHLGGVRFPADRAGALHDDRRGRRPAAVGAAAAHRAAGALRGLGALPGGPGGRGAGLRGRTGGGARQPCAG